MGFFDRLKEGLLKTKKALFSGLDSIFSGPVDEDMLEELEEVLIMSDIGVNTAESVIDELRTKIKSEKLKESDDVKKALSDILVSKIGQGERLNLSTSPSVVLVIGVNGVGKTTSIAKIANVLKNEGKSVVLAAADTFRAAAIDQLGEWAKRVGVEMISHGEGSDPAAVVFDAIAYAKRKNADVVIVDTAGRLHNKKNLMDELSKIDRVIEREAPGCARENLFVIDATTGQNAVRQAVEFKNTSSLTGLVLTKLDGTAKGGIVFSIKDELDVPVKFICVGEHVEDLQYFEPTEFVNALFS